MIIESTNPAITILIKFKESILVDLLSTLINT